MFPQSGSGLFDGGTQAITAAPRGGPNNYSNTKRMAKFESIQPGSLGGPARSQHDLRNLAREHAQEALALILKVLNHPKATPQARIAAARSILERGWGEGLHEQVRPYRHEALKALYNIMNDAGASLRTRLAAADALLDFGGGESRTRVVSTMTMSHNTQRWLDELREIQAQFSADRPTPDRPGSTRN